MFDVVPTYTLSHEGVQTIQTHQTEMCVLDVH